MVIFNKLLLVGCEMAYSSEQAGKAALEAAEEPDEKMVVEGIVAVLLGTGVEIKVEVYANKALLRTHSASVQEGSGARGFIAFGFCAAVMKAGCTFESLLGY